MADIVEQIEQSTVTSPVVVIHAGAGYVEPSAIYEQYKIDVYHGLNAALDAALNAMKDGGSSLDAVQAAVVVLEDCPRFNAGYGAVLTADGHHELDASIMNGSDRRVGSVIGVKTIKNPVKLARAVMDISQHVTLACDGAERFADTLGESIERVPNTYFSTASRVKALEMAKVAEKEAEAASESKAVNVEVNLEQGKNANLISLDKDLQYSSSTGAVCSIEDETLMKTCEIEVKKCFGTVGAVALDTSGNLAAATSTGGMTNKKFGRVGDSPIIGAGTWADDQVAASSTGWGEFFIRNAVAHDVAARVKYGGVTLESAADTVIKTVLTQHGGDGGIICVDRKGNIALPYNSGCMFRGWVKADGSRGVAIYNEELTL